MHAFDALQMTHRLWHKGSLGSHGYTVYRITAVFVCSRSFSLGSFYLGLLEAMDAELKNTESQMYTEDLEIKMGTNQRAEWWGSSVGRAPET